VFYLISNSFNKPRKKGGTWSSSLAYQLFASVGVAEKVGKWVRVLQSISALSTCLLQITPYSQSWPLSFPSLVPPTSSSWNDYPTAIDGALS